EPSLDLVDLRLGLRLDVGLVRERLDRLAELGARLLDVLADLLRFPALLLRGFGHVQRLPARAWAFVSSTSRLTLSRACSGTGGVDCWTLVLPVRASTPAITA